MSTEIEAMNEMYGDFPRSWYILIGTLISFAFCTLACPHLRKGYPDLPPCDPNITAQPTSKISLEPAQMLDNFLESVKPVHVVLGGAVVAFVGYKVFAHEGGRAKGLEEVFLLDVWGFVGVVGVVGAFGEVCCAVGRGFGFEVGE